MNRTQIRNWLVIGLTLASATTFQGCSSDQVDAVGAAVILAGAVVVAANTHCVAGYRQVCHSYINYFGNEVTECRQEWDNCASLEVNHESVDGSAPQTQSAPNPIDMVTPVKWGDTFAISFDSSAKLIDALKETQLGKIDQLETLGLTHDDLIDIAMYKMPPDDAVNELAKNLNASVDATRTMLDKLLTQMANKR